MGSIAEQFDASVKLVNALPRKGSTQPSYADMAKVYAYFKQAQCGECDVPKPSFWDPVGRAKWEAWSSVKSMPKEEAMQRYVAHIKEMFEKFRQTDEFKEKHQDYVHVIEPFCKATGTLKVSEQEEDTRSTENNEIHSILKVNGTTSRHSGERNGHSGMNGDHTYEDTSVSNSYKDCKPAVRINGVHEVNSFESEHAALSHNIIENILRSGEESLKAPSDDTVRDSDLMTQSSVEPGYVYLQDRENKDSEEDRSADDSDNEIYCDSLGELPETLPKSTPKADSNSVLVGGKDAKCAVAVESSRDKEEESGDNGCANGHSITTDSCEIMHRRDDSFGDPEFISHADLSSLSSGSGYEQVGPIGSLSENRVKVGHQKISFAIDNTDEKLPDANDDLSFLEDCKAIGGRRQQGQKGGPRKSCNKSIVVSQSDNLHSGQHRWEVAPGRDVVSYPEIAGHKHSSKGASHGDNERHGSTNGSRREGDHDRSHGGHTGRARRTSDRVQGQSRGTEQRPYRNRQTSSSSESDSSGAETIGEKILHCLERLQVDVKGIERRLTSIEHSIKSSAVTPAPWWYKYLPSKTVACLILWPLMLNLVLLYIRRRKRK